jgi:hypothetical protein
VKEDVPQIPQGASSLSAFWILHRHFLDFVRRVLSLLRIVGRARKAYKIFLRIYPVCKNKTTEKKDLKKW